jgi:hypothetical protein
VTLRALNVSTGWTEIFGEAWREGGALGRGGVLRAGLELLAALFAGTSFANTGCDGCFRFRELPFCCADGFGSGGAGAGVTALDWPGVSPGLFLFNATGAIGAGSLPLRCLKAQQVLRTSCKRRYQELC